MAVFGAYIIDSDLSIGTYNGILNLYHNGADNQSIESVYPLKEWEEHDAFDNELYVTACALGYWEIGLLNEQRLNFIRSIIDKGVSVKFWNEESEKSGARRKKELDWFWKKITKPKKTIVKRRCLRKIKYLLNHDDVIQITLPDNKYSVFICVDVDESGNRTHYELTPTNWLNKSAPFGGQLTALQVHVRAIATSATEVEIISTNPGIESVWKFSDKKSLYRLIGISVPPSLLRKVTFEKIGKLSVHPWIKKFASIAIPGPFRPLNNYLAGDHGVSGALIIPVRAVMDSATS